MAEDRLTVDARGLSCPVPVLKAKKALESIREGWVEILVDEPAAVENVSRLVAHMGCSHECEPHEHGWRIIIRKFDKKSP